MIPHCSDNPRPNKPRLSMFIRVKKTLTNSNIHRQGYHDPFMSVGVCWQLSVRCELALKIHNSSLLYPSFKQQTIKMVHICDLLLIVKKTTQLVWIKFIGLINIFKFKELNILKANFFYLNQQKTKKMLQCC